jgi:hypothetical protein
VAAQAKLVTAAAGIQPEIGMRDGNLICCHRNSMQSPSGRVALENHKSAIAIATAIQPMLERELCRKM